MVHASRYALVVLALALVAGCSFGQKARDNALLPSLRLTAESIAEDAAAGVASLPESERAVAANQVAAFFTAFGADPPEESARLLWPAVAGICEQGFQARLAAGTIGPNVAGSLREQVVRFGQGLSTYFREES